jgi:predicted molibdopterin-dependent oxidoreductase YjgC
MSEINIWVNDRELKARSGQTILQAADEAGIVIPRLCYHPALAPSGSCRLCAVEIDGYRGLPAACATPVEEGMRIRTETGKLVEFRREMLRLILQDHPRECLGCPRNGTCELQQLVAAVGIDFPYLAPSGNPRKVLPAGAYFERDYGLCVRCGRCVRICHEVRGAKAIVFREAEGRQEVSTPFERDLASVGCQFCGACVDVCPVGALREVEDQAQSEAHREITAVCEKLSDLVMTLYRREIAPQWASSLCPLCGAGCRLMYRTDADGGILEVKPHPQGPANRGQACVQGRFLLKGYLQHDDRLQSPLVRDGDGYAPAPWPEALDRAAEKLRAFGPGEVAVITDCRGTNEELYLLQKFARQVLKTQMLGCLAPSGHLAASEALRKSLGLAAATNSVDALRKAPAVLAVGLNPAATHPIAGTALRDGVLQGTKLVVIDPCLVSIAKYGDLHLRPYPGTEKILLRGLLRVLLDEKRENPEFAAGHTAELHELKDSLAPYDLETVARITGVSQETIVDAVCTLGGADGLNLLYGLGVAAAPDAGEIVASLVALAQVTGSLGRPGGGIMPLYGSGNLQGAWDMGMVAHLLPGQVQNPENPEPVDLPAAMRSGGVRAAVVVLENLEGAAMTALQADLAQLDFVLALDVRGPTLKADIVLPMAAVPEKNGTLTTADRRVQAAEAVLQPPGAARDLIPVLNELASRLGADGFAYENFEAVLTEIRREVPAYAGVRTAAKPVHWPCPDETHPGTPVLFADELPPWQPPVFDPPPPAEEAQDETFPFALVAKERLEPFFSGPLLAREALTAARHDGKFEMNPADGFGMGLRPGDAVRVSTRSAQWEGPLAMNALLPAGMVAIPGAVMGEQAPGEGPTAGGVFAAAVEKVEQKVA